MAIALWNPGRRLFTVGSVLMILTAAAHTAGHFSPSAGPEEDAVFATMQGHRVPLGLGMTPSILDIFKSLSLTLPITFVAIAALNLAVLAGADSSVTLLRRLTWVNLVWVGVFGATMLAFHVLPPLICAVVIEVVLLASVATRRT